MAVAAASRRQRLPKVKATLDRDRLCLEAVSTIAIAQPKVHLTLQETLAITTACGMVHLARYDDGVRDFSPPSCVGESLSCQLLVVGGGLSGLSAADAAARRGVDVIVIEKGAFGRESASALNAGQFLTGWAKPVDVMLEELKAQEQERGTGGTTARSRAEARVRAFLRRTVEGCQRLTDLDHAYNIRSSVRHGAVTAAVTESDLKSLQRSYDYMEKSSFRALMPLVGEQRWPFFKLLSARQLEAR
jgi:FAD dependent oxidoreductase